VEGMGWGVQMRPKMITGRAVDDRVPGGWQTSFSMPVGNLLSFSDAEKLFRPATQTSPQRLSSTPSASASWILPTLQ
jgi:hypothetical protein